MNTHRDERGAVLHRTRCAAVAWMCLALAGCGSHRLGGDPAGLVANTATLTAPATRSPGSTDHSAAVVSLLSRSGLNLTSAEGSSLDPTAQILSLDSPGAEGTVTYQPDKPVLRAQFEGFHTLPDGTRYAVQHAGYGGVSVLALKGGRAVILTLVPKTLNGPLPMDDSAVVHGADSLVSGP